MYAPSYEWQAMLRETGQPIGTPRTATVTEMVKRAHRLPGVVWYRIGSQGYVVYAPATRVEEWTALWRQGHI